MIHRLGAEAPKKSLVENYMIEIARNYKVDYDPDPSMFLVGFIALLSPNDFCLYIPWLVVSLQEDDVLPSEPSVAAKPFLPDDEPRGGGGGGGGGGGAGPLPQKEEPRYIHTPQSQQPPSASNQVHNNYYVLCEYCTVCNVHLYLLVWRCIIAPRLPWPPYTASPSDESRSALCKSINYKTYARTYNDDILSVSLSLSLCSLQPHSRG